MMKISSFNTNYLGLVFVGVSTLMFLNYARWLRRLRRKQFLKRKKDGSVNIGGKIFPSLYTIIEMNR